MLLVTTITTTVDVDTLKTDIQMDVDDRDGLHQVSRDVLGSVLLVTLNSATEAARESFPRAAERADRLKTAEDTSDSEDR